jgi:phage baseplate assembly protein W
MHIGFPLSLDSSGRIRQTTGPEHVRDLIEQVLFTAPGERAMRPEFGSGARHLVFEPAGEELAATTEYAVRGALQRYLGGVISVHAIRVSSDEATVRITIQYAMAGPYAVAGAPLRTESFESEL